MSTRVTGSGGVHHVRPREPSGVRRNSIELSHVLVGRSWFWSAYQLFDDADAMPRSDRIESAEASLQARGYTGRRGWRRYRSGIRPDPNGNSKAWTSLCKALERRPVPAGSSWAILTADALRTYPVGYWAEAKNPRGKDKKIVACSKV